jgi:transposase
VEEKRTITITPKAKKKLGRPRKDDRKIMSGIFYVPRTGWQ